MAALTQQDKLALALTSAGSMRELARRLGVTHQKVGRWLREGEGGGVRQIPAAAAQAIGRVFKSHIEDARSKARAHGLPFSQRVPIYAERRPLETGELGDRVFSEHTQFIRREVLNRIVERAHQTGAFVHVSARSVIDLHSYARSQAKLELASRRGRGGINERALAKAIADSIAGKEKRIMSESQLRPLFTSYTPIYPGSDKRAALAELNTKLREKHEPSTGAPGTRLADQLLMQMIPKPKSKPAHHETAKAQSRGKSSTRRR